MAGEFVDNREERVTLWRSATALNDAWWKFGNEREKRLQIDSRGTSASLVYMHNLAAEVFSKVAGGELIAVGYRLDPTISDGPVIIPADAFDCILPKNWGENEIQASGWRWERVRVLRSVITDLADDLSAERPATVDPGQEEQDAPSVGRRNTYEFCLAVFQMFEIESPSMMKLSAEKLEEPFRARYDQIHGAAAVQWPAPKARTLRTHLARYRAAKTGKNQQE